MVAVAGRGAASVIASSSGMAYMCQCAEVQGDEEGRHGGGHTSPH
uniref:Uncharacterized protein n=1 Tax=Pseudomonas phage PACT201 TaxID=3230130 RepID=A0AAU8GSH2_9VIRU